MRTWGLMLSFIHKSASGRIATSEKVIKSLQYVRMLFTYLLYPLIISMYLVLVLNNGT